MTAVDIDERLAGIEQGIQSLAQHQEELFRLFGDRINYRDAEIDARFPGFKHTYTGLENRTGKATSQPENTPPSPN